MNPFDLGIIHFLNAFAHRSEVLDSIAVFLMGNGLITGGVLMSLFWAAWVSRGTNPAECREVLIFGLMSSALSLFVARTLALSLPFRVRPVLNPIVDFRLPYSMSPSALIGWSSFPSDHAALFFGLAATLYLVSRPIGILAFLHAFFVVNLPRVYTGVHYSSDILAGAALGCTFASLAGFTTLRARVTWSHPELDGKKAFSFLRLSVSLLLSKSPNYSIPFGRSPNLGLTSSKPFCKCSDSSTPGAACFIEQRRDRRRRRTPDRNWARRYADNLRDYRSYRRKNSGACGGISRPPKSAIGSRIFRAAANAVFGPRPNASSDSPSGHLDLALWTPPDRPICCLESGYLSNSLKPCSRTWQQHLTGRRHCF